MRRLILIGDVHGCVDELQALLRAVGHHRSDKVVLVGDLVAKGPDSQGVVQLAREVRAWAVRGNHDDHVLRCRFRPPGSRPLKPHHQQVVDTLKPADWAYLERLPLYCRFKEHNLLVVHAGIVPGTPLRQQRIDNLLNLRSIAPDGRPSKKVEGGVPWASRWEGPEQIVFGHDAVRGVQQHPFATGLDSGCVYGRELTALILPEKRFVSVKARRAYCEQRP